MGTLKNGITIFVKESPDRSLAPFTLGGYNIEPVLQSLDKSHLIMKFV